MLNSSEIQTVITALTVVFAAGVVYNKVGNLERKIDKIENLNERIATLEVEVRNLKQKQ